VDVAVHAELATDLEELPVIHWRDRGRLELDLPGLEHLGLEGVLDLDLVLVGEGLDPAGSLDHLH
jgi:hypothetical protein